MDNASARLRCLTGLAAVWAGAFPMCSIADLDESKLVERLQQGGNILVVQHLVTGRPARTDAVADCRDKSAFRDQGWRDAISLGTGLHRQAIRIERAVTSPDCRARYTAYLAFGVDKAQLDPQLGDLCRAPADSKPARLQALNMHLSTPPPHPGVNVALVTHACNLRAYAQPDWPDCATKTRPGDALVFAPRKDHPPELLGCLSLPTLKKWSLMPW